MSIRSIVDGSQSISDKIRKLDAAGLERAEIARLLGKRYQHVRNVLVADLAKASAQKTVEVNPREKQPGVETLANGAYRLPVNESGAIVIPASLADALGALPGEAVIAQAEEGRIILKTRKAALMEAQALVRSIVGPDVSLVDELIEDRRREAEREG